MKNYQTLSLIGGILGMLIAFGVYATMGTLHIVLRSLENSTNNPSSQTNQAVRNQQANELGSRAGLAIMLYIIGIAVPFTLVKRPKITGSILLVVAVSTLFLIGLFGVVGFGLFLPAGIVALAQKKPLPIESRGNHIGDTG
jgi:Kef-type K+ transport system membrane component KefB